MNISKGDTIIFKGYAEPQEEGEEYLTKGQEYKVEEVNAKEKSVSVRIDNPDFNPKKPANDKNPKTFLVDVFAEEFEIPKATATGKAKAATSKAKGKVEETEDEAEDEAEDEVEEAPAPKAKAKVPSRKEEKAAAKTKVAPKGKAKASANDEESEEPTDPYGDLTEENEDEEIVALVKEADSVLDLAKEVAEEQAATEYKLGGILFHVRKSGAYKELNAEYAEKGGFSLYVLNELNVEYRKAMYLIDIYYKWNKFGLDHAKVSAIGWAKAAKIAAVMTEDTAEELVELAENNTVADLIENIKTNYKEVGGTKGEKKKLTIFKFRLFEERGVSVQEVLSATAQAMGFTKLDEAFEHIVMEWAAEHPVEKKTTTKAPAKAAPTKAKAKA